MVKCDGLMGDACAEHVTKFIMKNTTKKNTNGMICGKNIKHNQNKKNKEDKKTMRPDLEQLKHLAETSGGDGTAIIAGCICELANSVDMLRKEIKSKQHEIKDISGDEIIRLDGKYYILGLLKRNYDLSPYEASPPKLN